MNSRLVHAALLALTVVGLVVTPLTTTIVLANEDLDAARRHFQRADEFLQDAERDAEAKQLLVPDPVEYRNRLDAASDNIGRVERGLDQRAEANEAQWAQVDWIAGILGVTGVAGAAGALWKRRLKMKAAADGTTTV